MSRCASIDDRDSDSSGNPVDGAWNQSGLSSNRQPALTGRCERHNPRYGFRWDVRPCVRRLLDSGCPTTVRRLVVPVVVDALNGRALRPLAHVAQEVREPFSAEPPITDLDSATSIVWPRLTARVSASRDHGSVSVVQAGAGAPMRAQLRLQDVARKFAFTASTTHRGAATQRMSEHDACVPAVAYTAPALTASARVAVPGHDKASEPFSNEIQSGHARANLIIRSGHGKRNTHARRLIRPSPEDLA